MTSSKKLRIGLIIGMVAFLALMVSERLSAPGSHGFTSTAQARIGRPLTPVSVAGVARRTVRRCAVGVYNC
jgi:hypothetical protein